MYLSFSSLAWQDLAIGILSIALVVAGVIIFRLRGRLREEIRKSHFPLLVVMREASDRRVYLQNDSYCYAKNIRIADVQLTVDYGFKKIVTLKFYPIDMLRPGEKALMHYRVFDGEHEVHVDKAVYLLSNNAVPGIEIFVDYENLENISFKVTSGYRSGQFHIKETTAQK